jgi:hypothetical protein
MLTVRSVVARIRMILFPLGLRHNPGHAPPRACAIGEPSSCRRCCLALGCDFTQIRGDYAGSCFRSIARSIVLMMR